MAISRRKGLKADGLFNWWKAESFWFTSPGVSDGGLRDFSRALISPYMWKFYCFLVEFLWLILILFKTSYNFIISAFQLEMLKLNYSKLVVSKRSFELSFQMTSYFVEIFQIDLFYYLIFLQVFKSSMEYGPFKIHSNLGIRNG